MTDRVPEEGGLEALKELILASCGLSLDQGRERALLQGARERMARRGVASLPAYHALLLRDREEFSSLVELLTVNETYFFREPELMNLVADKLLAEILATAGGRRVRIVSAGCSTGEEPYSVAMMLKDRYGADCGRLFSVTGVDIDASAVAAARRGVYGRGSFRGVGDDLVMRHFEPCGDGEYRVRDEVKGLVDFHVANLVGPAYPEAMNLCDVIFYRNVSIYFPPQVQRSIFGNLASLLNDGGYLVVGATETLHHDYGILSLVQRDSLFCYRKSPLHLAFAERRAARRNPPPPAGRPSVPPRPREGFRPSAVAGGAPRLVSVPLPSEVKGLFDAALELACGGREDDALEKLEKVIEADASFSKALTLKGSLLVNGGRFKEAALVCNEVVLRDPLCLEGYLMLGVIARHEGDDEGALKRFREAIYLDPACWLAHFTSAEILASRGESGRARSAYESALRSLEKGHPAERGTAFFPLSFNAEQFMVICRHKLSLLMES